MDRREALKKLAAGGAVAAGATAVMTNTAFAANGSADCPPSSSTYNVTAAAGSGNSVTFTANLVSAAPTCGCGTGTFQTGPTTQYAWTIGSDLSTSQTFNLTTPNKPNPATAWQLIVTVRCIDRRGRTLCSRVTLTGTVSRDSSASPTYTFTGLNVNGSTVYNSALNC